jgi:hypothetical protein
MAAGENDASSACGEDADRAVEAHWYDWGLALDSRSLLYGRRAAPPWMRAELDRLRAAFPEFSFGICPGWRGPMFEAWRETGTGDLYALITADVRELWRELEASQRSAGRLLRRLGKNRSEAG